MHSRMSPDHRVPVHYSAASSSPSSSTPLSSRPRRRQSQHGATTPAQLVAAAQRWLGGRVGHWGLRRWMVVAGLSTLALLLVSSSSSSSDELNTTTAGASRGWGLWRGRAEEQDDDDEPPVVDRSALEKLRLLEIHFGADEEDDGDHADGGGNLDQASYSVRGRLRDPDAPPLVAEIPEVVKVNPSAPPPLAKMPADVLDEQTCGARNGAGCQFLVPAWLGEQETKAQQHLYQLGLLAVALNRTLVLPNVSKSRLGTCYKNPFDFYYSSDSLAALGIPTISQDDFVAWTLQREPPPSAQVVSMVNAKATYTAGAIEIDSSSDPNLVPAKPSRNLCLRSPRTRLDFTGHSPLAIFPPEGFHKNEDKRLGFGESVINTLRSRSVGSKSSRASSSRRATYSLPDVLAFNYELRFPILSPSLAASFSSLASFPSSSPSTGLPEPSPFSHFPYADTWTSLGSHLAASLSPFVAIHWRTETLTPSNLAPCASSLLHKLLQLKEKHPSLENVYLATDYPIEALDPSFGSDEDGGAAVAHSGTFAKVVTEQHHAAMRRFLRDFEKQAKGKLRLTTFAKEARTLQLPPSLHEQLVNLTTPPPPLFSPNTPPAVPLPSSPDSGNPNPLLKLSTLDPGLLGILDKEVAVRAELFLTGVPGVGSSTKGACAKLSSFTNQLVGAREERRAVERGEGEGEGEGGEEDGGEGREREETFERGRLWNGVSHFSLSGEEVD
ncbi:hypothetical protein JCM8547_007310 [Rhodosporidiobolus lusitaniae]